MSEPTQEQLDTRRKDARQIRVAAAEIASKRNTPATEHKHNQDENLPFKLMSFTKGLIHNVETGLVEDTEHFNDLSNAIDSGDPDDYKDIPHTRREEEEEEVVVVEWISDFAKNRIPLVEYRSWESASAGLAFDLQGPDSWAVTMKPAPSIIGDTDELTAEMGEVYAQALLRDVRFHVFYDGYQSNMLRKEKNYAKEVIDALGKLHFFNGNDRKGNELDASNAFRGFTDADFKGPYISQFLLAGTAGLDNKEDKSKEFYPNDGLIRYGGMTIDQRVRKAKDENYLTNWEEYIDVQNGANLRGLEGYDKDKRRFITTGRDLATYVHYDALYQAYLNACLILLETESTTLTENDKPNKFDPGVPFQEKDVKDQQQGFALYGGPHILTLVTEVATRALKAVRYQKFNIHKRLRPEALAARFEKIGAIFNELGNGDDNAALKAKLTDAYAQLEGCGIFDLLKEENDENLLLPMAFREGSPMHPSYGAGHATVAAACITILKAFFNEEKFINISEDGQSMTLTDTPGVYAFLPNLSGRRLDTVKAKELTVGGELNKLASNISIGRDWAGVHFYSDYTESMKMGEKIAIGLLQEQSLTYHSPEGFSLSLTRFEGGKIRIENGKIINPDTGDELELN